MASGFSGTLLMLICVNVNLHLHMTDGHFGKVDWIMRHRAKALTKCTEIWRNFWAVCTEQMFLSNCIGNCLILCAAFLKETIYNFLLSVYNYICKLVMNDLQK